MTTGAHFFPSRPFVLLLLLWCVFLGDNFFHYDEIKFTSICSENILNKVLRECFSSEDRGYIKSEKLEGRVTRHPGLPRTKGFLGNDTLSANVMVVPGKPR